MKNKIPNINFMGIYKYFMWFSVAFILVGIVLNFVFGTKLSIEFAGGSTIRYPYQTSASGKTIDHNEAEKFIKDTIKKDVIVTESKDVVNNKLTLVVTLSKENTLTKEQQTTLTDSLKDHYKDYKLTFEGDASTQSAQIGSDLLWKGMYAILIAFLLVIIYVGFRFRKIGGYSAAIMALAALVHDCIIIYFTYVIFQLPLDFNFLAVILTILGYSLNDTIVIYDRIRENRDLVGKKMTFREMVNLSLNQSFSRTIVTAAATLIAVLTITIVALVFGMNDILGFSLPMTVGVIAGCYSTVFIAGPIWVMWSESKEKKSRLQSSK